MPLVSRTIKSYLAALRTLRASLTCLLKAKLLWRVANERMYTLGWLIAFMRIRSPSRAPPVLRFEGSTLTKPTLSSGKWRSTRRTNSSTIELLPAPPVPVMPKTGAWLLAARASTSARIVSYTSGAFSAAEIMRATERGRWFLTPSKASETSLPMAKSHFWSRSLIIP